MLYAMAKMSSAGNASKLFTALVSQRSPVAHSALAGRSLIFLVLFFLPGSFAVRCFSCYDDPGNGAAHDTDACFSIPTGTDALPLKCIFVDFVVSRY